MLHSPIKLPRPPIDLILISISMLMAAFAGRTVLLNPTANDAWIDVLFLSAVLIFLIGIVRVLVRTFSIEDELEELSTVREHRRNETDAAAK